MEVWHFDMLAPPEESARVAVDLAFTRRGMFNAVLFWYELQLSPTITISTGPGSGVSSLRPALQYMPGTTLVEEGMVIPLLATHNTVRLRFDLEEAEYVAVAASDVSIPHFHFAAAADEARIAAYEGAIARAISKRHVGRDQST